MAESTVTLIAIWNYNSTTIIFIPKKEYPAQRASSDIIKILVIYLGMFRCKTQPGVNLVPL